jgi:hypothetical protein
VHRQRQDAKTKIRQRAVWRFVVLSLATTWRTKVFKISHLTLYIHTFMDLYVNSHSISRI